MPGAARQKSSGKKFALRRFRLLLVFKCGNSAAGYDGEIDGMDNRKLGNSICLDGRGTGNLARHYFVSADRLAERMLRVYVSGERQTGSDRCLDAHLCIELGRGYCRGSAAAAAHQPAENHRGCES
jgi:hypothetical protein